MPRTARLLVGGYAYHILNRANGRLRLFRKPADFAAFEEIVALAHERVPLRILGYVLMSNHWHFVVWPTRGHGEQVSDFFRWLTITHAQRWHAHHGTAGTGHVYQGRFKSFPVASDEHLLSVLRYVERNPLRAGLVKRAEDYTWSSLPRRLGAIDPQRAAIPLAAPPLPLNRKWLEHVNQPQTEAEVQALMESIRRGRPYGSETWQRKVAGQLHLESTFRPRGRPKKEPTDRPSPKKGSRPL